MAKQDRNSEGVNTPGLDALAAGRDGAPNPYLAARREWMERYGDVVKSANNWRLAGVLGLLAAVAAIGGVVYIGAQSRFVPYVVEVDHLGSAVAVRPAQVAPSNVGVVTSFGQIEPGALDAGIHLIKPWENVTPVYLGQQTVEIDKSEASSRDLQSVHADLVANFTVSDGRALFALNTSLNYPDLIVGPAIQEVFKAVVARYTAEELVTKRQDVSVAIAAALSQRLAPYNLKVQVVNLTNFGFSQAFDQAIEQKVTASQQAETAKRNLERIQYEADARVEQAKGEAEAIRIQTATLQQKAALPTCACRRSTSGTARCRNTSATAPRRR